MLRFWFTPANVHDVKVLDYEGFLDWVSVTLIGDNAYRGVARQEALAARGMGLLVCPRKKDRRMLPIALGALLHTRWRIETVIGQLKACCGLGHLGSCRSPNALRTLVFSPVLLYTLNWETASA